MTEIKIIQSKNNLDLPVFTNKTKMDELEIGDSAQCSYEAQDQEYKIINEHDDISWEVLSPEGIKRVMYKDCLIKHPKQHIREKQALARQKKEAKLKIKQEKARIKAEKEAVKLLKKKTKTKKKSI